MKKYGLLFGIVIILIIGKIILTNPYQLTQKQSKKLKEIEDGLLIKDFYTLIQESTEEAISYKDLTMEKMESFECKEEKKLICTKEETTLEIEEEKSYLEKVKEFDKNLDLKGIKNDIDLFGRIKDSTNTNRLFRPIFKQKQDYSLQLFALKQIPIIHSLDLISGDIEGYITHPSSEKRIIYLTKDKKTYKITLKDLKYFSRSKIQELLNSIKIKD